MKQTLQAFTKSFFSTSPKSQFLIIAEHHKDLSVKITLQKNIAAFKEARVGKLYMEMFLESEQPVIEGFYKGNKTTDDLKIAIKKSVREGIADDRWTSTPGLIEHYIEIIKEAKNQGIAVIAIDKQVAQHTTKGIELRNNHWLEVIKKHAKDGEKAILYAGALHIGAIAEQHDEDDNLGIDGRLRLEYNDKNAVNIISGIVPTVTEEDLLSKSSFTPTDPNGVYIKNCPILKDIHNLNLPFIDMSKLPLGSLEVLASSATKALQKSDRRLAA